MTGIPWLRDEGDGDWRIAKIDRFEAEGGPYPRALPPRRWTRAEVGEAFDDLLETIDPGADEQ